MTTAICFFCGSEKFGALGPCLECKKAPVERVEIVRSMYLSDHYLPSSDLATIGQEIKAGREPQLDSMTEKQINDNFDDEMIREITKIAKSIDLKNAGKFERNVCLVLIAIFVVLIGVALVALLRELFR